MIRITVSSLAAALTTLALPVQANPVAFAPLIENYSAAVFGSNASFVAIDGNWQGSTVLWQEPANGNPGQFGTGSPIGSYAWGTGIWGRADWDAINAPGGSGIPRLGESSGVVSQINHGDTCYNSRYSFTWGTAQGVPLTISGGIPASGCPIARPGVVAQNVAGNLDNWTSRYTGYIRIAEAGLYNFSVLYDDGFFFDLYGANGQRQSIAQDFLNPRDRLGFANDFLLTPGLYQYELGAWDRLEAGVIDLRWARNGSTDWEVIPTEFLVAQIPVPGPLALAGLAAMIAGAGTWRRRRRTPGHLA